MGDRSSEVDEITNGSEGQIHARIHQYMPMTVKNWTVAAERFPEFERDDTWS